MGKGRIEEAMGNAEKVDYVYWLPLEETPEEIRKLLKPGELAPRCALYASRKLEVTDEDAEWARSCMRG